MFSGACCTSTTYEADSAMIVVDRSGLAERILKLLQADSEVILEVQLLRSGSVMISKSQEDGKNS